MGIAMMSPRYTWYDDIGTIYM